MRLDTEFGSEVPTSAGAGMFCAQQSSRAYAACSRDANLSLRRSPLFLEVKLDDLLSSSDGGGEGRRGDGAGGVGRDDPAHR